MIVVAEIQSQYEMLRLISWGQEPGIYTNKHI